MDPAERTHPDSETLERFLRGRLSRSEVAIVVRHLLTACPRCLEVTRRLWSFADRAPRGLLAVAGGAAPVLAAPEGDGCRRGAR